MPRLFVAINLPCEITDKLFSCCEYLKKNSIKGNPSRKENLHLTLAFIGETNNIRGAVNAMKETACAPFDLCIKGFSQFTSKGESLFYAKADGGKELCTLAEDLRSNLIKKGFQIDTKPFKPHITLCRQFIPTDSFSADELQKILSAQTVSVKEICLMRSDRINGKLTYTQVHKKLL